MNDVDALARAAFARAGLEVSDDDLALVRLVHDGMLGQLAVLDDADPARFPFEPVDPARPPSSPPPPSDPPASDSSDYLSDSRNPAAKREGTARASNLGEVVSGSLQDLSLREQAAAVAAGELDPGELLDATLDGIAARDGDLRSTPVVFPDDSRAMLTAAPDGPLRGVPVTVKDMFSLPWRGACNGTAFELFPASASGPFRRLRDAGAVVGGVANQHELGLGSTGTASVYGPSANPWDLSRCAGGSSGGSAAAVAARLVAGSLGSDSGGSTRLPAAWCGVVGLKVTYRSLPYDGYFGQGTTFSAPGVFGRDAADARLLASALLARSLPAGNVASLRVGVVRDPLWSDVDPAVAGACEGALASTGWTVHDVEIEHLALAGAAAVGRLMAEFSVPPAPVLDSLAPVTRALLLASLLVPARAVPRAERVRAAIRHSVATVFESVDVLAWPATPAPAPPIADPWIDLPSGRQPADAPNLRQATLANLCGLPGISVPVGTADGLPVGLQLLAPWGEEARLLDAAEHVERTNGVQHYRPVHG